MPGVSLLSILANIDSGPFPPSDADQKNQVHALTELWMLPVLSVSWSVPSLQSTS